MKKIFYFVLIFLFSCGSKTTGIKDKTKDSLSAGETKKDSLLVNAAPVDSSLLDTSLVVLGHLKQKNYAAFAAYFHPTTPVRFSPYAYVDTNNVQLNAKSFLDYCTKQKNKKLNWGTYDGEGGDILMTVPRYIEKYIYDVDFVKAPQISMNKKTSYGNIINNIDEVYKGCDFVEYYFKGFDPSYDGMDWRALRLVYKKYEGRYYLVGIIHDQWST